MKKLLLLSIFISCTTVPPIAVPTKPIPLTAEQQWEIAKHEQDVAWDREVQQRTFDELKRDIKEDLDRINKIGTCIENEDKTWYDCTKI